MTQELTIIDCFHIVHQQVDLVALSCDRFFFVAAGLLLLKQWQLRATKSSTYKAGHSFGGRGG